MKHVLSIAGSDPSGGAGIQADLKTFSHFRVYGMAVITALTAQNSTVLKGVYAVPPEFVEQQLEAVYEGADIHAIKTGMLASADIVERVGRWLKKRDLPRAVVDPVFVATAGGRLTALDAKDAYVSSIFPSAYIVTPNIPEAELLTGAAIITPDEMKEAARIIYTMGPRYVLIKGGHLEHCITDILYDGETFSEFSAERIDAQSTHGTGCTLSSAVAALLARYNDMPRAVNEGIAYVRQSIAKSVELGKGHWGLNHEPGYSRD